MKIIKIIEAAALASFAFGVVAQESPTALPDELSAEYETPAMPIAQITENITSTAKAYADSISCGDNEIDPKKIAALKPWTNDLDRLDAMYAVIWSGDISCSGGSGAEQTNITIVKIGAGSSFYVDPKLSSPVISLGGEAKLVSRLVGNTSNTLVLEGLFYGEKDPGCCPSLTKKFTLKLDENGNWK